MDLVPMGRHTKAITGSTGFMAWLLLILTSGRAAAQLSSSSPLYQVHGSGTSNPAPLIWRVMDIMMARTKPRIAMSYRSIGSGAGGSEFAAYNSSAFGCGDVPINSGNFGATQAQDNPMLHIPFLVGSVSIFHNIPGIGEGFFLPPCLLAEIFRGNISQWNHPDIVAANPHLPELNGTTANITIVHRNEGSSSTYALTHYLNKTCPGRWGALPGVASSNTGAGTDQNRRVGVTSDWPQDQPGRWVTVTNSQTMVEKIASNPYSLGYVESGQGLLAGLEEVTITNANNVNLTSSSADIAPEGFIRSQFPLTDLGSANWTRVNPVYADTSANQWPLTLGSYFYVRKNLTYLNETGGLLKLFLLYMLDNDVAAFMSDYSFIPLPYAIRQDIIKQVREDISVTTPPNWRTETGTEIITGQLDFVFSPKRDSYLVSTVTGLATDNKDIKTTLKMGDAYQVHGSGSFVSAVLIRHAMTILEGRARVPISMTYRAVGSVEAQEELKDYVNMYQSYNHFKVGDMPLDSAIWTSLNSNTSLPLIGAVLQLPFAISALGIYHTKAVGLPSLVLDCKLLARLYNGQLTSWNDPGLTVTFAEQSFTGNITVFAMAAPSAATYALTGYLAAACGDTWTTTTGPVTSVPAWPANVNTTFRGENISTPEQMLAALAATPNAVGYLPASLGSNSGLMEVKIRVEGLQSPLTTRSANLSTIVLQALNSNPELFSNPAADLDAVLKSSNNALYGIDSTWPMPMLQYLYMFRNLTGYGYSGPLLRAFVDFLVPGTMEGEGSQLALSSGLTPMPPAVQATVRQAVNNVILKTLTVVWDTETAGISDGDAGAALYTFSANRQSYSVYELTQLRSSLEQLQARLANELPPVLRVACTPDTFGYVRLLRADVQEMVSRPIRIMDEMGSPDSIVEILQAAISGTNAGAPTHMVVHPGPLTHSAWSTLSAIAPIVQIPATIRPVGLLYKGAAGLRLRLCTLARIIAGNITSWSDDAILRDNPGYPTPPNQRITLMAASATDADATAVLQYIKKVVNDSSCPEYSALTLPTSAVVNSPGGVLQQLVSGGNYTGLAFLAASNLVSERAAGAGLQAVALPSVTSGTFVTPLQCSVCQTPGVNSSCSVTDNPAAVATAYSTAVDAVIRSLTGVPSDKIGDWSGFELTPLSGADAYPVVRFDYLVVPVDLAKYGDQGSALHGVIKYAVREVFMERVQLALAPYFCALDTRTRTDLAVLGSEALITSPDSPDWGIVTSSSEQVTDPSATIVLGRAPPLSDVALEGSAMSVQYSSASQSTYPSTEVYYDNDKLNLTYDIAVAALVLGLILSLSALGLALYAVMALRSGGGGGGGASSYAKYEDQRGAGGHIQMGMSP